MSHITELAERYLAVWNEPDAEVRRRAIAALWTEDGSYVDPLFSGEGHAAIEALVAATRCQFRGHVFRIISYVDAHHNIARFTWELSPVGGGECPVIGFDVLVAAHDGRLRGVYGFLDKVPSS